MAALIATHQVDLRCWQTLGIRCDGISLTRGNNLANGRVELGGHSAADRRGVANNAYELFSIIMFDLWWSAHIEKGQG